MKIISVQNITHKDHHSGERVYKIEVIEVAAGVWTEVRYWYNAQGKLTKVQ